MNRGEDVEDVTTQEKRTEGQVEATETAVAAESGARPPA